MMVVLGCERVGQRGLESKGHAQTVRLTDDMSTEQTRWWGEGPKCVKDCTLF